MTEPFPLESVRTVPEHNGRYVYTYASGPEPGRDGVHVWDVSPANAPAVDTYTDEWGKTRTIYYDPARVQPTRGRFGHEWNGREMPGASVEALDDVPEGLLWRGMSDEEYQAARQNGYFESNGSYNIGDDQNGLTFFSTGIDHAGNYANGFAPSQHQAGFGKPAHVVGIPMRPWDWELEHEKGIRGRIPFSDVTHHYVGHAYAIKPGEERVYEDYMGRQPMGGGIGGVFVQWEPDHPADPGIPVPTAEESWKEASKYFFAWSPSTYTYRGPKVRPATPLPEGFVDTSDYNYTGSAETQYHHRSLTPEVMKGIDKRKDNIDAYYEEMRQRREQGLEDIPWKEWLDRVAFIRNAMDDGEYTLTEEARGNTAHRFMEQAGLGGRTFHIQPTSRREAEEMGVLPDQLQRQRSAEAEKYVNDILKDKGKHKGYDVRVEPEHWDTRERGSIAAWWPGRGEIGIADNKINELTLLHEVAHVLTNTHHDDSHGHLFRQTFHDLIHEKIGPRASGMYADLAFPYGISVDQMAFDYNKEARRLVAMAWDEWAPKIKHRRPSPVIAPNYYVYEIDHGHRQKVTDPYEPPITKSQLSYGLDHANKKLEVEVINTHPDYRSQGVAEALMRRAHEDYPDYKIVPGHMTEMGQGFHDRMLEKEPDAKAFVTANSLLVGPEDAYDEWEWFGQREQFPPVSADVSHEEWYHVSPHRIPEGTTLAPMRGQTPWNDDPYDSGLQNRANWIWLEYDKARARDWMHYILQHQPECFIYRVDPDLGPFAWNGTADEGWVTNRAVVVELLDRISRDLSFEEQSR